MKLADKGNREGWADDKVGFHHAVEGITVFLGQVDDEEKLLQIQEDAGSFI